MTSRCLFTWLLLVPFWTTSSTLVAQPAPEIISFSPARGPEGCRAEIHGAHLASVQAVWFATQRANFKIISDATIVARAPRHFSRGLIRLQSAIGEAVSSSEFTIENDPRVPPDVGWKSGYVNSAPRPPEFRTVLLWGIAIADTRYRQASPAAVEISHTELSCRIDGKEIILRHDEGRLRGGLYLRTPWFGGNDAHDPMPMLRQENTVVLPVGTRPDRIWHFWSASSRATLPPGRLEGCTATARVRISPGAVLQMGVDYWRSTTALWAGSGVNNHEAGASNWYFPSPDWQQATFTDIGGPQF